MRRTMSRTRTEILEEIEFFTKMTNYNTEKAEYWEKISKDFINMAEHNNKLANKAKQELKEYDEANK